MKSFGGIYKIKELISKGDSETAIKQMIALFRASEIDDKLTDTVILLSNQFMNLKQRKLLKLNYDQTDENRIVQALLELLSQINENSIDQNKFNSIFGLSIVKSKKQILFKVVMSNSAIIIIIIVLVFLVSISIVSLVFVSGFFAINKLSVTDTK